MKTAVIAVGGNAILRAHQNGTKEVQMRNLSKSCEHFAELIGTGYNFVFTHGNGPQVGNILIQNDEARSKVPPLPLDVCVAETQGEIGYMFQQVLSNKLREHGIIKSVVSVITQVVVDDKDIAFRKPTKPVGPHYSEQEAKKLMSEKGWVMRKDPRGGYRRVVPSPKPIDIVEREAIRRLVFSGENSGIIVIAAGGGGVPVIRTPDGRYEGVEAVVDKDLASSVLATCINEKLFIMLTDVEHVALDFGTSRQRNLSELKLEDAKKYLHEGQFPAGTMGPKIEAAIFFLEHGGEKVIITSLEKVCDAIEGKTGTVIWK